MRQFLKQAERSQMRQIEDFNPLQASVVAQSSKPSELSAVDLRELSPFQRSLLVIDSTVTTFLEVYTLEPVEVVRLGHVKGHLLEDHTWLEARKGCETVLREVLIRGKHSRILYAYAIANVVLERLPEETRKQLDIVGESLGRVLNGAKLETRREILWYGKEQPHQLPTDLRHLRGETFVSRTYRIVAHGKPIALVNEKFPSALENVAS